MCRRVAIVASVLVGSFVLSGAVRAVEPLGDLNVELRLVEVVGGVARVEATVLAAREIRDLSLDPGKSFPAFRFSEPVRALRVVRAELRVPVGPEGDVVVVATATGPDGEIRTEGALRVGAGRPFSDDGTVVTFRLVESGR